MTKLYHLNNHNLISEFFIVKQPKFVIYQTSWIKLMSLITKDMS